MIEDELLKWKFKAGSKDALRHIYEKYRNYLLTLAMALVNDAGLAEDIVQDVFVAFAHAYFFIRHKEADIAQARSVLEGYFPAEGNS